MDRFIHMPLPALKIVREDALHETIEAFIREGDILIADIDEMKDVICKMIKCGYMFSMDRDRVRDAIEDFTYMCQPEDDINKDRIFKSLEYDDEDSEDDFGEDFPSHKSRDVSCHPETVNRAAEGTDDKAERTEESEIEDIGNCSEK